MTRADWGAGWAGGVRAVKPVLWWEQAHAGRLLRGLSGSRGRPGWSPGGSSELGRLRLGCGFGFEFGFFGFSSISLPS